MNQLPRTRTELWQKLHPKIDFLSLAIVFFLSAALFAMYAYLEGTSPLSANIILAIAGSLMAAFIYAILMNVAKYADLARQETQTSTAFSAALNARLQPFEQSITNLSQTVAATYAASNAVENAWASSHKGLSRLLGENSEFKAEFIVAKHPKDFVREEIGSKRNLEIDALGLNLDAFYHDHLKELLARRQATLRILLPDPGCAGLKLVCEREGRDLHFTQNKIIELTKVLIGDEQPTRASVRWSNDISSITMVRINRALVWRPRFYNEQRTGGTFYCVFDEKNQPHLFKLALDEFAEIWSLSRQIDKGTLSGAA